ncbi:mCG124428, partial [Mus musculus]
MLDSLQVDRGSCDLPLCQGGKSHREIKSVISIQATHQAVPDVPRFDVYFLKLVTCGKLLDLTGV